MSFVFSRPKAPPSNPVPTVNTAEVQAAADAERQRLALAKGRSSTILGGENRSDSGSIQKNTLLGQ